MFWHILTICAVCLGFALVRTLRRGDGRAYSLVLVGLLLAAVAALVQPSRFIGLVAIGLSILTVVVPAVLESAARWAFAGGRLGLAVSLFGVRAMLMPGAGLGRQREILEGLALLEREGVDRAIAHFRDLAAAAEGGESVVIHEQIVSMLFYGQRWEDGIAHYEAQFDPRHAALRPGLALGLLRAYGESGRLETAAGLLRALEEGPVGSDPAAIGFVSQARLTFLAYTGAASTVHDALTEPRRRALGLSAANSALLRGIALLRAGETDAARIELSRVADVAGAADQRVVEASRTAMAQEPALRVTLAPELSRYAEIVARRVEAFAQVAPRLRRQANVWLAPSLAFVVLVVELVRNGLGRGGIGLLDLGAVTNELWHAGSWGRVSASAFLAGQPLGAFVDAYALWVGGRLLEGIVGRGRLLLVALGGPIAAMLLSLAVPHSLGLAGGAGFMAMSVATGALMLLPRSRTPGMSSATRRGLLIPLAIVVAIQLGGSLTSVFALELPLVGLWAAAVWAVIWVGFVPTHGPAATVIGGFGIVCALVTAAGAAQLGREDAETFLVARREPVTTDGVVLRLPNTIEATGPRSGPQFAFAISPGYLDMLALRASDVLALQVGQSDATQPLPMVTDPTLHRELDAIGTVVPQAFARRYAAHGGDIDHLSAFHLRRDGEDVALVVQRELGDGRVVAWVAAPPAALTRTPNLHAAILADAALE